MPLEKQVQIISVDTGNFYTKKERYLHRLNHELRVERNKLIKGYTYKNPNTNRVRIIIGINQIEDRLKEYGLDSKKIAAIYSGKEDIQDCLQTVDSQSIADDIITLFDEYCKKKAILSTKVKKIKESKERLLNLLENKVEVNIRSKGRDHIRELDDKNVKIVSFFESAFIRMIGAKINELTDDFILVQVYYFSILKDILFNGFMYKGERYRYFTSSAGQIRTKKAVFIKEKVWQKYEKSILCGLTVDEINKKGGINTN